MLDLLAYLTALTVDAVQVKHGPGGGQAHADRLAEALSLDMRQWWTPTVDGFFQRVPKAMLVSAVTEAGVTAPAPFDSVKKAEAARMAAQALAGSGWLPEPLKGHAPALAA